MQGSQFKEGLYAPATARSPPPLEKLAYYIVGLLSILAKNNTGN